MNNRTIETYSLFSKKKPILAEFHNYWQKDMKYVEFKFKLHIIQCCQNSIIARLVNDLTKESGPYWRENGSDAYMSF